MSNREKTKATTKVVISEEDGKGNRRFSFAFERANVPLNIGQFLGAYFYRSFKRAKR